MSVTKRDQLILPKRKKPEVLLSASADIYLPAFHFLKSEFLHARMHEKGIIRDDDCEFLHQYRVALRRCRALISLLKPLFEPKQKEMLKIELKALMQKTNLLRDLDVFLIKMDDYFYKLEHRYHQGLTCFFDELQDERRKTHKEIKKWFRTEDYEQQCQLINGLIEEMDSNPTPDGHKKSLGFGKHVIWKHFNNVQQLCGIIDNHSPDATLHQLRISCKKLRYLLEYFSPIFPSKTIKGQIKHLKQLQDELGNFNDTSIQLDFFDAYLERKKTEDKSKKAIARLRQITQEQHLESKRQVIKQVGLFSHRDNTDSYQYLYGATN